MGSSFPSHGLEITCTIGLWIYNLQSACTWYVVILYINVKSIFICSIDATWLATGTSRGFILVWDLRFLILVYVWRHLAHSAIHRLTHCPGLPSRESVTLHHPIVYVACGNNEVGAYDLSTGYARAIFRALRPHVSDLEAKRCTNLSPIPISRSRDPLCERPGELRFENAMRDLQNLTNSNAIPICTMMSPSTKLLGLANTLVTAGDDRRIRFWDLKNAKSSFTISGVDYGEPKSFYDSSPTGSDWKKRTIETNMHAEQNLVPPVVYMCQDSLTDVPSSQNPASERRGPIPPSPGHNDSILDLQLVDVHVPMILSAGRDGLIKLWR